MDQPAAKTSALDDRFVEPLYGLTEAGWFLSIPQRTFWGWARGPRPIIPAKPAGRDEAAVSFMGLAGGMTARAFREAGLSMQYIRKALDALERDAVEHGIDPHFALASGRLHKHGSQLLVEYSTKSDKRYFEAVTRNRAFNDVVEGHLSRITYRDNYARKLVLPGTRRKIVAIDPERASGQPLTIRGGARIVDLIDRFRGGESWDLIARDYEVPVPDLVEVIRAYYSALPLPQAS